ncbi:4'-phosphopantetheinyl transferase [Pedobacter yulinensis]|uniref:4'-phosphopantetheinyl transferase n=1 Tax=Pedobacter yulinensis TaxID=2126353 RepID=A0A2T3HQL3_9SPHI|nr:4'-phosphopantetheinyl transferase superfamily protein [Pedobacter yulinensis]PST84738.1 4'-phosphopantetheinyl transferase [Pedobacter yulinensis]
MPIVYQQEIDTHTSLALWKIEETGEELLSGLQLRQHERETVNRLGNSKRLIHWLSTRLLLRTMLNTDEYIDCRMDEHGKPYLINFDYHISLSHSYDYAAVMIGKTKKVGIDIELIKEKIRLISHKFLNEAELAQLDIQHDTEALYACWCAKEAVYKWNGVKGLEFRKDMHISPFSPGSGKLNIRVDLPAGPRTLEVNFLRTADEYMLGYVMG